MTHNLPTEAPQEATIRPLTSREVSGDVQPLPKPKRAYKASVSHSRSLLFSYIEGGHLPHYDLRRIEGALERLDRDHPEDAEALSRFHEQGDKSDPEGEARAVRKLVECLTSYLPATQLR